MHAAIAADSRLLGNLFGVGNNIGQPNKPPVVEEDADVGGGVDGKGNNQSPVMDGNLLLLRGPRKRGSYNKKPKEVGFSFSFSLLTILAS
jgi:hypothetical protein